MNPPEANSSSTNGIGAICKALLICSKNRISRCRSPIIYTPHVILRSTRDLEILVSKVTIKELQKQPNLTQKSTNFAFVLSILTQKSTTFCLFFVYENMKKNPKWYLASQKGPFLAEIGILRAVWSSFRISLLVRTAKFSASNVCSCSNSLNQFAFLLTFCNKASLIPFVQTPPDCELVIGWLGSYLSDWL